MVLLILKRIIFLAAYSDFANMFLKKLVMTLIKQTDVNKYTIKLGKSK